MILFTIIALIIVGACVVCFKKDNRPGMVACAILLIFLAIIRPFLLASPEEKLRAFDKEVQSVLTEELAERVIDRHPNKRIALIVGPEVEGMSEARINRDTIEGALKTALQTRGVEPLIVPLPLKRGAAERLAKAKESNGEIGFSPEMAYYDTLMEELSQYKAPEVNALLIKLKEQADVVIWTVSLSSLIEADKLIARRKGPKLVMVKSNVTNLEKALKSTVLDMHLAFRPGATWEVDYKWPKDISAAFDERYIIRTADNPTP